MKFCVCNNILSMIPLSVKDTSLAKSSSKLPRTHLIVWVGNGGGTPFTLVVWISNHGRSPFTTANLFTHRIDCSRKHTSSILSMQRPAITPVTHGSWVPPTLHPLHHPWGQPHPHYIIIMTQIVFCLPSPIIGFGGIRVYHLLWAVV